MSYLGRKSSPLLGKVFLEQTVHFEDFSIADMTGWPANFDFHFPGIFQVFPGDFSSFPCYFHWAMGSTRTHLHTRKDLKYKNQSSVILNWG